jgi:hypothetical protein
MSHMIRFPVLSLLMQDDQLAHLYITGFIEYKRLKRVHCMSHKIGFPILSLLMQDDQLAHLYIKGLIEYNKGLKSALYDTHDQISNPLSNHA